MNLLLYVFIGKINVETFRNLTHIDTVKKFNQYSSEMEDTKVILPLALFKYETSSYQPRAFENRMLRRILGPKRK
jgi:hypothetical protein